MEATYTPQLGWLSGFLHGVEHNAKQAMKIACKERQASLKLGDGDSVKFWETVIDYLRVVDPDELALTGRM